MGLPPFVAYYTAQLLTSNDPTCYLTRDHLVRIFIIRGAIGQEDGASMSPLVTVLEAEPDSGTSSRSIFANLKDHVNRTITSIKDGFDGAVGRVKQKVKDKIKEKTKEKVKERITKTP